MGLAMVWLLAACFITLIKGEGLTFTLVTSVSDQTDDAVFINEMMPNLTGNMIIFAPQNLRKFILQKRPTDSTVFIPKGIESGSQWHFSNQQKQPPNGGKALKDNQGSQLMTMITKGKLFMMVQALKHDKFDSKFLIWIDSKELHRNSERVLKLFYDLVQPRWLFFTQQSKEVTQIAPGFGEEKYINRNLKVHEQVNPSFMGGSVEILKDIKNAYESFLRVLHEDKMDNLQRNALSLMPIRFPSLIPYTASIKLDDIKDKVRRYCDVYRLSKQKRYFKGRFESDGQLIIKDANLTFFFQNNLPNYHSKNTFSMLKKEGQKMQAIRLKILDLAAASNQYYKNGILIDIFIFMILIACKIQMAVKTRKIKAWIEQLKRLRNYQSVLQAKNQKQSKAQSP